MLHTFILVLSVLSAPLWERALDVAAEPAVSTSPSMLGRDRPVFLGRMTVVAAPLPNKRASR